MRLLTSGLLLLLAPLAFASCEDPAGLAGPAAVLEAVSGDEQQDTVVRQLDAPLVARVVDEAGRPVSGHPVTFVIIQGGGSMFTGSTLTDAAGLARDRWTLGAEAGPQRVEARALTPTGETLAPAIFDATAVPDRPDNVAAVAGDAQEGRVGERLEKQLVVQVTDAYGNPAPAAPLTWTITAGGGTLVGASAATDSDGRGSASWDLGPRVEPQTVSVAAPGTANAVFTAVPVVNGELALIGGDAQSDTVAATLGSEIVVALRLADGRPVVGATVEWATAAGSASPAFSVTDEAGEASTAWTLGTTAGAQALTASIPERGTVTATAVAHPAAPVDVRVTPDSAVLFPVGDTASFSARAFDRFGNLVGDAVFTWTSTNPDVVGVDDRGLTSATGTGRTSLHASSGFGSGAAVAVVSSGDIVFASDRDGSVDIYVLNADGTGLVNLTRGGGWDYYPAFSPGGDTIAFTSDRDGGQDLYLMDLNGTILARLTDYPGIDSYPVWSPDGTRLAFERQEPDGRWNLYVVEVAGGTPSAITTQGPGSAARFPAWSPDGGRIAYSKGTLNSTGSFQTATVSLIDPDGTNGASIPGRTADQEYWPAWSPDGSRIAYVGGTTLAVMDTLGGSRATVSPQVFSGPAWSPSGLRVLFAAAGEGGFQWLDLFSTEPDGSDRRRLTSTRYITEASPAWR